MPAASNLSKYVSKITKIDIQTLADMYENGSVLETVAFGSLVTHRVIHPAFEKPVTIVSSACGANMLIQQD